MENMDELEAAFETLRQTMVSTMIEEGFDPNDRNVKIQLIKEFIEELRTSEEIPTLVKRVLITIFEYEIETLETIPDLNK